MVESSFERTIGFKEFEEFAEPIRRCRHPLNLKEIERLENVGRIWTEKKYCRAPTEKRHRITEARRCGDCQITKEPGAVRRPRPLRIHVVRVPCCGDPM